VGILNIITQKLRLAGWPVYYSRRAVAVFCFWQQPAGHAAVTKRGDKLAFARHDTSTAAKSVVRAGERAGEGASSDLASFRLQFSIERILTSALKRYGAFCACHLRGV